MAGVTVDNMDSFKSDFSTFKQFVTFTESSRLSASQIDGFQTKIADVSVGAFNDAVGTAFIANQANNKTDIQSIATDLSSGGLKTIKNIVNDIQLRIYNFDSTKQKISSKSIERAKLPLTVKVDGKDVPNPADERIRKEIVALQESLKDDVTAINTSLNQLAGVSFGSSGSDNPTGGDDSSSSSSSDSTAAAPTNNLEPYNGTVYAETYTTADGRTIYVLVDTATGMIATSENGSFWYVNARDGAGNVQTHTVMGSDMSTVASMMATGNPPGQCIGSFPIDHGQYSEHGYGSQWSINVGGQNVTVPTTPETSAAVTYLNEGTGASLLNPVNTAYEGN